MAVVAGEGGSSLGGGEAGDLAGVRTASEKSRQISALLPASSRASGGVRVFRRWQGGRRNF